MNYSALDSSFEGHDMFLGETIKTENKGLKPSVILPLFVSAINTHENTVGIP